MARDTCRDRSKTTTNWPLTTTVITSFSRDVWSSPLRCAPATFSHKTSYDTARCSAQGCFRPPSFTLNLRKTESVSFAGNLLLSIPFTGSFLGAGRFPSFPPPQTSATGRRHIRPRRACTPSGGRSRNCLVFDLVGLSCQVQMEPPDRSDRRNPPRLDPPFGPFQSANAELRFGSRSERCVSLRSLWSPLCLETVREGSVCLNTMLFYARKWRQQNNNIVLTMCKRAASCPVRKSSASPNRGNEAPDREVIQPLCHLVGSRIFFVQEVDVVVSSTSTDSLILPKGFCVI